MKLVVFGATGGTGSQIVARGLALGHDVTAVARRPEAITTKHDKLRVVKGDVLDAGSVASAIAGADAVLSAIGPANDKKPGTLISEGVKNIVAACEKTGVKKFVFESGLMVGDARGLSIIGKAGVAFFRWLNRDLCEDKRKAEATIRASTLEWVIVRPPSLDDSAPTYDYVFGPDCRLNAAKKLSHADAADFLIKVAGDGAFTRTVQDVGH